MAMIPSLSVWSSVKFPFSKYPRDVKISKPYSVESCDDFIRRNYEKSREEDASEMVNLIVPRNLGKEKSVPNLYCECAREKNKWSKRKKKNRQITFVTVPEIIPYEKECPVSSELCESDLVWGDKVEKGKPEDKRDETGSIPAVKPWTLEELVEINRRREEANMKVKRRKNKRRGHILKNRVRALKSSNELHPEGYFALSRNSDGSDFAEHSHDCDLRSGHPEKDDKRKREE